MPKWKQERDRKRNPRPTAPPVYAPHPGNFTFTYPRPGVVATRKLTPRPKLGPSAMRTIGQSLAEAARAYGTSNYSVEMNPHGYGGAGRVTIEVEMAVTPEVLAFLEGLRDGIR